MKKMLLSAVCAIVLCNGIVNVNAKETKSDFDNRPSIEEVKKHQEKFASKLGLSEEQKEKAKELRKEGRKKMEPLMKQKKELHEKMEKIRKENMSEFEKILTDEQKQKLKELKKEHKGKHFGKPSHHKDRKNKHDK